MYIYNAKNLDKNKSLIKLPSAFVKREKKN